MQNEREFAKVNRRAILALATLPLLGIHKPSYAMTEAEELVKLQAEASRIQEIFDVQKAANANLPSLKDGLKAAKLSKSASTMDEIEDTPALAAGKGGVDSKNVVLVRGPKKKKRKQHPPTHTHIHTYVSVNNFGMSYLQVVQTLMESLKKEGDKGMEVLLPIY